MKKTLLFVLTLAGLSAVSARILTEYFYLKKPLTWAEARIHCRQQYNELVPVTSYYINKEMQSLIHGVETPVWIGLYDDLRMWRWSLNNESHNSDNDFQNWRNKEPNNFKSLENCTVMNAEGYWLDLQCMDQYPMVCYQGDGPIKYKFVNTPMTWPEARSYCRTNHIDLASITNSTTQLEIAALVSTRAWIGLNRMPWSYWSNGLRTVYTNWHTGQPNIGASCTVINATTGTWSDASCKKTYPFICFKWSVVPDSVSVRIKIRFQSKADLKDPALQKQVLEQFHAKLKEHGLPDYKLRWLHTDEETDDWEEEKKD